MKLITTTDMPEYRFGMEAAVDMIAAAGYDGIDFSAFREEFFTDAHPESFFTELRRRAEDKGVPFVQAHAPFHFPSFNGVENTPARKAAVIGAMRNASLLGVERIVIHPLHHLPYRDEGVAEQLFELSLAFYRDLLPYAEEWGITIATENMYHKHRTMITHSVCSRPEEMVRMFDEIDHPLFTCCLDIGHTYLVRAEVTDFIRKLGKDRLGCLHVHDVDSEKDLHTLPYFGEVEWDRVMGALAQIGYEGNLTYEADGFLARLPQPLYPDAERFMASVGRYLIASFEAAKR